MIISLSLFWDTWGDNFSHKEWSRGGGTERQKNRERDKEQEGGRVDCNLSNFSVSSSGLRAFILKQAV